MCTALPSDACLWLKFAVCGVLQHSLRTPSRSERHCSTALALAYSPNCSSVLPL